MIDPKPDRFPEEQLDAWEHETLHDPNGRFFVQAKKDGKRILALIEEIRELRQERTDLLHAQAENFANSDEWILVRAKFAAIRRWAETRDPETRDQLRALLANNDLESLDG